MESIKQEIINNIYENGENLITGPILQTVLLDMVDDVNDKVASASAAVPGDLVEKTGSWDDAADWVEQNSSSVVLQPDLDGYATEQWVEDQGYLKEVPEGYATTESLNDLSESVAQSIADIPEPDLSNYATKPELNEATESVKEWVENKHYLTTASLSGSVTEESVQFMINDATSSVKDWVGDQNYATETFVSQAIAEIPGTDLTGYATEAWVEEQGYLTEHQDISGLATTSSVNQLSESVAQTIENLPQADLSGYLQTSSYLVDSASFDSRIKDAREEATTAITNVSEGVVALSASFDSRINDITGSDLSGYATTESVNQLSSSVATDIQNARTEASQAITGLGTIVQGESDRVTGLSASFDDRINNITGSSVDLSGYATTASVNSISQSISQSIDALAGNLNDKAEARDLTSLSESVAQDFANLDIPDVSGFATTSSLEDLESRIESVEGDLAPLTSAKDALEDVGIIEWSEEEEAFTAVPLATSESVAQDFEDLANSDADSNPIVDFLENAGLATRAQDPEVGGYEYNLTPVTDLSESVASDITSLSESIAAITGSDLSGYATTASVNQLSSSVATDILNARTEASAGFASVNQGVVALSASFDQRINTLAGNVADKAEASDVTSLSESVAEDFANLEIPDVSGYATTQSVNSLSASFDQRINDLPGGEKIWVRGTGSGSAVLSGSRSTASGKGSVAEGELTKALGNYSHAEGYNTTASGSDSHAEGAATTASGSYSHAEGYYSTASGYCSHAEGRSTVASGFYSHAEGYRTVASGTYSHAEGSGSVASGTSSHAEGLFTTASGTGSHAQGLYTIVKNEYEVGIGKFNTRTDQNHRGRIFSLGVGTDDSNRKDAIVVYTGSVGPRILVYGVGGYDGTNPDSAKTLAQTISEITGSDLSGYATTESVNQISYSVDYRLDQLEQEKEIPFWSSGSGEYSVVRKNGSFAEAIGEGSIFLGYGGGRIINANYYRCEYETWTPQPSDSNPKYYLSHEVNSSQWDRVEVGQNLVSDNDHLGKRVAQVVSKGQDTSGETAGMYWITLSTYVGTPVWLMLVEVGSRIAGKGAIGGGCGTDTSNDYETGLGKYSRSGSGQIFSVGVGSSKTDRRNAISIVTGSNPSASVYIYGVGSYDGTNPQPGTNDLASVIASGGTSYNVETWTFVLEDSSSVTKNVVVA